MNNLLTIITPTYNRAFIIKKAFESLQKQTCNDFKWLIVDDGSSDNTEEVVNGFITTSKFPIEYIKQSNGGKHRALNTGIKRIATELTLILDSDDYLLPEAVEVVYHYWNKVCHNENIAFMSFLRAYPDMKIIGDKYPQDAIISDHLTMCMNGHVDGDKSEVYRTMVLKEFPFPEIPNEKFLSEGVVWNRIGKKYKSYYRNLPIYVTEYLEGGLTKSGIQLRLRNPIGSMLMADECTSRDYKFSLRLKYSFLYDLYYVSAYKRGVVKNAETRWSFLKFLLFPCAILYFLRINNSNVC